MLLIYLYILLNFLEQFDASKKIVLPTLLRASIYPLLCLSDFLDFIAWLWYRSYMFLIQLEASFSEPSTPISE